jgi:uncharacterized repeat protein (TIGR01451 family)
MRKMKLLAAVAASAVALASAPAFAEGTASNTTVSNTATLSYQTGGVTQGGVTSNPADFLVDRKVNLTVVEVGNAATQVVGGQLAAVTQFTVTNTSNASLDFSLTALNQAGGAGPFGGTDNFDVTNIRYVLDANNNGIFDTGETVITKLSAIPADASRSVLVVADIPAGRVNNDVAAIFLVAQAQELGTTTNVVQTTTADNPAAVDTVFADGAGFTGSGDIARDGKASSRDQYTVTAASIALTKIATVISDPFNGTTNPKAIPGAVIEYCLIAANSGSNSATAVTVTDVITGKPITYVAGSGVAGGVTTGTGAATTCDQSTTAAVGGDPANGAFAAGTFTGNIGTVPAGASRTARFRVTVN